MNGKIPDFKMISETRYLPLNQNKKKVMGTQGRQKNEIFLIAI